MPIRPENRDRTCGWCRVSFEPYRGRRDVRWCSVRCKKRAASAAPRQVRKACAYCGVHFLPKKSAKQRYCLTTCRTKAKLAAIRADPDRCARRRTTQKAYTRTSAYRTAQCSAKARRRTAERSGTVTVAEWQAILDRYGHRCAYCGDGGQLTMDHVIALAIGGRHEPENVVPSCGPCNSSKGTADWSIRLEVVSCP